MEKRAEESKKDKRHGLDSLCGQLRGRTGGSKCELRAQRIDRGFGKWPGQRGDVLKGMEEETKGASSRLEREMWQGAASQRQKVCEPDRQRGWI